VQFPKYFDSDAKSLVRHLLVDGLSKRYGNLKDGTSIVTQVFLIYKNHRYINSVDWGRFFAKKVPTPFKPILRPPSDTSHFFCYKQEGPISVSMRPQDKPFRKWD
jgi:hypothetical protein